MMDALWNPHTANDSFVGKKARIIALNQQIEGFLYWNTSESSNTFIQEIAEFDSIAPRTSGSCPCPYSCLCSEIINKSEAFEEAGEVSRFMTQEAHEGPQQTVELYSIV